MVVLGENSGYAPKVDIAHEDGVLSSTIQGSVMPLVIVPCPTLDFPLSLNPLEELWIIFVLFFLPLIVAFQGFRSPGQWVSPIHKLAMLTSY